MAITITAYEIKDNSMLLIADDTISKYRIIVPDKTSIKTEEDKIDVEKIITERKIVITKNSQYIADKVALLAGKDLLPQKDIDDVVKTTTIEESK